MSDCESYYTQYEEEGDDYSDGRISDEEGEQDDDEYELDFVSLDGDDDDDNADYKPGSPQDSSDDEEYTPNTNNKRSRRLVCRKSKRIRICDTPSPSVPSDDDQDSDFIPGTPQSDDDDSLERYIIRRQSIVEGKKPERYTLNRTNRGKSDSNDGEPGPSRKAPKRQAECVNCTLAKRLDNGVKRADDNNEALFHPIPESIRVWILSHLLMNGTNPDTVRVEFDEGMKLVGLYVS